MLGLPHTSRLCVEATLAAQLAKSKEQPNALWVCELYPRGWTYTRHAGSSFNQRDSLEPASGQQMAVTMGLSFNWHCTSFLRLLRGFPCKVACGLSHPAWRHQHAKASRLAEPAPLLVAAQRSSRLGSYSSPIFWYRSPSFCARHTVGALMFFS